jgi:DNA-binding NtrC family response regulator
MPTAAIITESTSSPATSAAHSLRRHLPKLVDSVHILCVSPFPDDHKVLERALWGKTWRIDHAASYRSAISLIDHRRDAIRAVICEVKLPDGTWRDLLHHIRDSSLTTPLIVCSQLADADLWVEVLNVGGFDVLAKPFSEEEVVWVLESAEQP